MKLRPYQLQAKRDIYAALRKDDRAGLMAPTGSGKTVVAQSVIEDGLKQGKRITFIADRINLIDQTHQKFYDAGFDVGVQQGNHPCYRPSAPVQVASVQTLARRKHWSPTDLVIVDEFHCQYDAIYKQMERWNTIKWMGLSATPFTRGLGIEWRNLVTTVTTKELIDMGFLSPYVAYGHTQPDLTNVRTRLGDFAINDMEAPCNEIVGSIADHYAEYGEGRKALGFTVNVAHAHELAETFVKRGLRADYVDGKDTPERRDRVLSAFRGDGLDVLFNCEVLTKGLDIPDIGCLILGRPTKSLSMHIQMVGRGLRAAEGKEDCLILDHAGNIERMGFPDDPLPAEMCMQEKGQVTKLDKKNQEEPLPWNCPKCHSLVPPKTRQCPCCGFIPKPAVEVKVEKGILKKLKSRGLANKQDVWSQLLCIATDHNYKRGWASHKYREIFGVFPRKLHDGLAVPTPEVRSWVKSQQIRYAKRRKQ